MAPLQSFDDDLGEAAGMPRNLTIEEKIAQLFVLGFEGRARNGVLDRFLNLGLGGVIFFRDNFQGMESPAEVRALLDNLDAAVPDRFARPFLSVDQEGGQVERLPCTVFPATVTPRAIAVSAHPEALARETYSLIGQALVNAGFNMNYFPTLDVNLNNRNPVIGVRSFGSDPQQVSCLSDIAMRCYADAGILTVGKHFPGHGNGTVDSHEKLPTLKFTQAELSTFKYAIKNGLPCMMVAHGWYPGLQPASEAGLPASASPTVITQLLRQQLGFKGLIMTDDLCMGAVMAHPSAEEAALRSLEAGVDMLLYKQSTELEWRVFEAVVAAVKSGRISEQRIDESLARIARVKNNMARRAYNPSLYDSMTRAAQVIASGAVSVLTGDVSVLPLQGKILLVHPDRAAIGNYAFDMPLSPELPEYLSHAGLHVTGDIAYAPQRSVVAEKIPQADVLVFVGFNAVRDNAQVRLYSAIKQANLKAQIIVVSVGTPDDIAVLPGADLYLATCSYRPPTLLAISQKLAGKF